MVWFGHVDENKYTFVDALKGCGRLKKKKENDLDSVTKRGLSLQLKGGKITLVNDSM